MRHMPLNLAPRVIEALLNETVRGLERVDPTLVPWIEEVNQKCVHWSLSEPVVELIRNTDMSILEEDEDVQGLPDGHRHVVMKLPYPAMTVEVPGQNFSAVTWIGANQEDNQFTMFMFAVAPNGVFYCGNLFMNQREVEYVHPRTGQTYDSNRMRLSMGRLEIEEQIAWGVFGIILRFTAILECDNVPHRETTAPKKLNQKRAKKGRPAIPSYKTVHITDHTSRLRDTIPGEKGSHASPRPHWRRGHFRRYKTNDGTVTRWIRPIIVNADVGNPDTTPKVFT